ncbi:MULTISPECIES: cupin domain-containing protein [unclassified Psychrobacter]|uniref:cupin domain-containing protein n=1 Tax=unclassified Psychrobacter TaxID=196806 RepID=UPI00071E9052|nr:MULTISPECIES: cupin domain-containing protein [unclassified Psychrobacter]OLF38127.1 anti-sigma factor [Psychrobacter sp. Cmf 22.2]
MLINADFSRRAELMAEEHQWIKSPQNGVERVMLDRVGAEKARATSLVRYAPRSHFPHHQHPGGEEILVLSGTFSADDKHYPAGWYLRNPPTSGHTPYSDEGAVIFVKLRQMSPSEERHVAIDTHDSVNWQRVGNHEVCALFSDDSEQVSLQRLSAGDALFTEDLMTQAIEGGAELLVVKGTLLEGDKTHKQGSWLRLPVGVQPQMKAGTDGTTVYLKTGHLAKIIGADVQELIEEKDR